MLGYNTRIMEKKMETTRLQGILLGYNIRIMEKKVT